MHALKILNIEDDVSEARFLQECCEIINRGFESRALPQMTIELYHQAGIVEGIAALRTNEFDVLLLDLNLPGVTGLEGLENIVKEFPNLPIIIVSVIEDPEVAIMAIRAGAQDYLMKDEVAPSKLARVVRYAIERLADNRHTLAPYSGAPTQLFEESERLKALREIIQEKQSANDKRGR